MRDATVLALVDVLAGLAAGYKECAQKIYAAEYVLLDERGFDRKAYVQMRARVMAGEPGLGLESEKWNVLAERIETTLAELRKELSRNLDRPVT